MKSQQASKAYPDFSDGAGSLDAAESPAQKQRLVQALTAAREEIASLRAEVEKLCAPPSSYGVYLSANKDGTVNVLAHSRKIKVNLRPALEAETFRPGQEVVLNEGLNVVEAGDYEIQGEVVILKEQLDAERALVTVRADEDRVTIIADPLRAHALKTGDHLLLDPKSGYLLEKIGRASCRERV